MNYIVCLLYVCMYIYTVNSVYIYTVCDHSNQFYMSSYLVILVMMQIKELFIQYELYNMTTSGVLWPLLFAEYKNRVYIYII